MGPSFQSSPDPQGGSALQGVLCPALLLPGPETFCVVAMLRALQPPGRLSGNQPHPRPGVWPETSQCCQPGCPLQTRGGADCTAAKPAQLLACPALLRCTVQLGYCRGAPNQKQCCLHLPCTCQQLPDCLGSEPL